MEIGEHRFCHKENGKDDCGTFKFAWFGGRAGIPGKFPAS